MTAERAKARRENPLNRFAMENLKTIGTQMTLMNADRDN